MIYDRNGKVIADNVIGYSVSVLAQVSVSVSICAQLTTYWLNGRVVLCICATFLHKLVV